MNPNPYMSQDPSGNTLRSMLLRRQKIKPLVIARAILGGALLALAVLAIVYGLYKFGCLPL